HRFEGVKALGVDEHVWRHTRRGDKYVTVIIDPDPHPRGHRSCPAAGHGRRPLQASLQAMARRTRRLLARGPGGGHDGRPSPASRPPPPRRCPRRSRSWIPSTLSAWPATPSTNAAAGSSRTLTGTAAVRAT